VGRLRRRKLNAAPESSGGDAVIVAVIATAYCLNSYTYTGTQVAPGTVAVDPRVIPLGSRLRIPGYGRGRALDTGSAIKGRRIDVWFASCATALMWGKRHIFITVKEHA
jgi:3D (Asp-Asp-Asp) domain-containing protein